MFYILFFMLVGLAVVVGTVGLLFLMSFGDDTRCEDRRSPLNSIHCSIPGVVISSVCVAVATIGISLSPIGDSEAGTYSIAKTYVGLHERKHRAKLTRYVGVNPSRTPWCGAFAGAVVKRSGKTPPAGFMKATSWRNWGKGISLKQARKGDVVLVRTSYGHHVGFYAGMDGNRVRVLGGNQSNQVKVSSYRIGSVRAVRRGGAGRMSAGTKRKRNYANARWKKGRGENSTVGYQSQSFGFSARSRAGNVHTNRCISWLGRSFGSGCTTKYGTRRESPQRFGLVRGGARPAGFAYNNR